jgi:2-hydroxychromene-2-carboxylate isomerase
VKNALRKATDSAAERGVFGVPSLVVGEQVFWGDDRVEEAVAAAS